MLRARLASETSRRVEMYRQSTALLDIPLEGKVYNWDENQEDQRLGTGVTPSCEGVGT